MDFFGIDVQRKIALYFSGIHDMPVELAETGEIFWSPGNIGAKDRQKFHERTFIKTNKCKGEAIVFDAHSFYRSLAKTVRS